MQLVMCSDFTPSHIYRGCKGRLLGRVAAVQPLGADLRKVQGSFWPKEKVGGDLGWSADGPVGPTDVRFGWWVAMCPLILYPDA